MTVAVAAGEDGVVGLDGLLPEAAGSCARATCASSEQRALRISAYPVGHWQRPSGLIAAANLKVLWPSTTLIS